MPKVTPSAESQEDKDRRTFYRLTCKVCGIRNGIHLSPGYYAHVYEKTQVCTECFKTFYPK